MVIHKIHKSGFSCSLVIPRTYLAHLGLALHAYCVIELRENCIEIKPLSIQPDSAKRKFIKIGSKGAYVANE